MRTTWRRVMRAGVLALAGAFVCLVAPQASTQAPASVAPHRIVSLVPAATEMLFAIGAGPEVVGVSSFDTYPPEVQSRPKLGALIDPDFERILTLRPDLAVVYATDRDLVDKLQHAGLSVFEVRSGGVADVLDTIRQLGARVGRAGDANRVAADIDADLNRVRALVAGRPRPKTALIFERDAGTLRGIFASGGVGFLHDLLAIAGGDDVFGDVRAENLQVSTELLLARAPDAIVEIHPAAGWTADRIARERIVWNALSALPAVRHHRIYILADDRLSIPGPRIAESARLIAEALHPEAKGR